MTAFAPAPPSTSALLPHLSWHPRWRPALHGFAIAALDMPKPRRRLYEPGIDPTVRRKFYRDLRRTGQGELPTTWHSPISWVKDSGLRREMLALADSLYHAEPPTNGAAILVNMSPGTPESMWHLFGFLRAAIVRLADHDPQGAVSLPGFTATQPCGDGSMPLHSDMFVGRILMNVYNDVPLGGDGESRLLEIDTAWWVAHAAGMPESAIKRGKQVLRKSGLSDNFAQFAHTFNNGRPWSAQVNRALDHAAYSVQLGRGQGYLVDDRKYMHGRGPMTRSDLVKRGHRFYRLAWNNERMRAELKQRLKFEDPPDPIVLKRNEDVEALRVFSGCEG